MNGKQIAIIVIAAVVGALVGVLVLNLLGIDRAGLIGGVAGGTAGALAAVFVGKRK